MRAVSGKSAPPASILAIFIVPVLSHLVIMFTCHVPLGLHTGLGGVAKLGFVSVSALTHWCIYTSLLTVFALTLRPGREPLITAMVRRMHGLTPETTAYTRKVTIAWALFFAAQLATSVALFCFAPLVVWSFFVNILDLPLVAGMFAAEYTVRLRVLENPPRESFAAILRMVSEAMPGTARPALEP